MPKLHYSRIDPFGTVSTLEERSEALEDLISLVEAEISEFIAKSIVDASKGKVKALFKAWKADLRKTFGLDDKSPHHDFLSNRKMYLLLRDILVDFGSEAQHNPFRVFKFPDPKLPDATIQLSPHWSVHKIVLEITSIVTREEWSKRLSIRFVEALYEGMKKGLNERMLDRWRDSARDVLLLSRAAGTSLTSGSEHLSLSKATTAEEYSHLNREISKLLIAIEESNTRLSTRSGPPLEAHRSTIIQAEPTKSPLCSKSTFDSNSSFINSSSTRLELDAAAPIGMR
ncbi:hypothetical protein JCM3765_005139 [Sporobolomyces pararoseus]